MELVQFLSVATTSLDYFNEVSGVDGFNTVVVDADDGRINEVAEKIREMGGVGKLAQFKRLKNQSES